MRIAGSTVLVTGGSGFIGQHLIGALLERGAQVRVTSRQAASENLPSGCMWLTGDLQDAAFCAGALTGVDCVIHLAALHKNVAYHKEYAQEVQETNLTLSRSLAQHVPTGCRVVFFSTALIQDRPWTLARPPDDGYVMGKALEEVLWEKAAAATGFPLLILRPVGVYGPGEEAGPDAHVIPSLVRRAQESAQTLTVWGDGRAERCFLFVRDLAAAAVRLLEADATGIVTLRSSEAPVTVAQLAATIRNLVKPELRLAFDPDQPRGVSLVPPLDLPVCLEGLAWTPLEEGLRQTVAGIIA